MKFPRPVRLTWAGPLWMSLLLTGVAIAQQAPSPAPAPPPKPANPFETVPTSKEEAPKPAAEPPAAAPTPFEKPAEAKAPVPTAQPGQIDDIIEAVEFRGARRVPQATLQSMIFSRRGDRYDEEALNRDFVALWNSNRFDDIRMEREPGKSGWVIRFILIERRTVRTINYKGNKSISISEILDKFKEKRVGLSVESQYDPSKVQRASVVLKDFLSERGRQFAVVKPEIYQVPPSSLAVTFNINEGPKVKVGKIDIQGNKIFSDVVVRRAMKNLKPIGIPYSILFEGLFDKSFDSTKFEEDQERIRNFYQEKGYFTARVTNSSYKIRDTKSGGPYIPLFNSKKPGKRADLTIQLDEGRKYTLGKVNVTGMKLFKAPDLIVKGVFGMNEGDTFSIGKLRKGYEEMGKLYGRFGYIDAVTEPYPEAVPNSTTVNLNINVDEGKQFFVRRIDFQGNSTTRDKVIRRELLVDEGDVYNTALWEISVLRLNQLGFFEALKEKEATDIKRNTRDGTVDLTLNVKERGRNTVQLNGGVSGIAGSFLGFGYSTNNFLGFGETLSLDAQLGDRIRAVTFGFSEPYLFDKPIQAGFTVSTSRYNYDQAREVSLLSGRNLLSLYNNQDSLRYIQQGYGFTVYASTLLRKSFARVGLTYGFNVSSVTNLNSVSQNYLEFINFRNNVSGPNALDGIRSSTVTPSYVFNTVNHPLTPTAGKEISISVAFSGGPLGGNVNVIEPTFNFRYFRASPWNRKHIIGTRFLGRFLSGYGGLSAPPLNRFYSGGENDIRGFEIYSVTPFAYIPQDRTVNVLNDDGSNRTQRFIASDGTVSTSNVTQTIPTYQITPVGGDTQGIFNLEYRIPIFGPVTLAAFLDAGVNRISLPGQLRIANQQVNRLNGLFPQASYGNKAIAISAFQRPRVSTGLELQVLLPVVNAPFRLYYAYNPSIVRQSFTPPLVIDRSYFPNERTFESAISQYGAAYNWRERKSLFRFSIGRTF